MTVVSSVVRICGRVDLYYLGISPFVAGVEVGNMQERIRWSNKQVVERLDYSLVPWPNIIPTELALIILCQLVHDSGKG